MRRYLLSLLFVLCGNVLLADNGLRVRLRLGAERGLSNCHPSLALLLTGWIALGQSVNVGGQIVSEVLPTAVEVSDEALVLSRLEPLEHLGAEGLDPARADAADVDVDDERGAVLYLQRLACWRLLRRRQFYLGRSRLGG